MSVWIALGKVLLAVGLMFYTLVTMCGGNPMGE
jgi:amino acid transporter